MGKTQKSGDLSPSQCLFTLSFQRIAVILREIFNVLLIVAVWGLRRSIICHEAFPDPESAGLTNDVKFGV